MMMTIQADTVDPSSRNPVLEIPTEIWLEIVSDSYFLILDGEKDGMSRSALLLSRIRISTCPTTVPPAYRERQETLRALSQTCRAFRALFLPLLWERVEEFFEPKNRDSSWHARYTNILVAMYE
ncbi:hypothetical protein B0H10DRAFT_1976253 [Mycena sp. CBHHK59/15]|nr:hypothetical protein B0H10DRAFT_1976253 [Mycena sp. CBHHK59/15]